MGMEQDDAADGEGDEGKPGRLEQPARRAAGVDRPMRGDAEKEPSALMAKR
jgi:hypothetical protein